VVTFYLGVPKELATKKMNAPDSAFMRSGELLLVKFHDKKATGEKDIFVEGVANLKLLPVLTKFLISDFSRRNL